MSSRRSLVTQHTMTGLLMFGFLSGATSAGDLSKYRTFQLGAGLPLIAKQLRVNTSEAKVIHSRPSLMQDLEWRGQPPGQSSPAEASKDMIFSFFQGELFRIVIKYDRNETEGMTAADMIEAVSMTYGAPAQTTPTVSAEKGRYRDEDEVVARWEDSRYRFDLIRSSYGGRFSLTGVLKRLEQPARAADLEATALDLKEAPQREVERMAKQDESDRANLDKLRVTNKPKFRP
jgi:hypothetical protein